MEVKAFEAKVRNLGNSSGIIVPKWITKAFDIELGDEVEVHIVKKNETLQEEGSVTSDFQFAPSDLSMSA